uniref:Uncharacterized protein n=1 Tax=Sphaerodactylus townsendi TaxID=933632 RepID=A0ACB8EWW1_9SAUR
MPFRNVSFARWEGGVNKRGRNGEEREPAIGWKGGVQRGYPSLCRPCFVIPCKSVLGTYSVGMISFLSFLAPSSFSWVCTLFLVFLLLPAAPSPPKSLRPPFPSPPPNL